MKIKASNFKLLQMVANPVTEPVTAFRQAQQPPVEVTTRSMAAEYFDCFDKLSNRISRHALLACFLQQSHAAFEKDGEDRA